MSSLHKTGRKITYALLGCTRTEIRTYEATCDEPWGPTNLQMEQLAKDSKDHEKSAEIKGVLNERMHSPKELVPLHKTLILLEFLILHGNSIMRVYAQNHRNMLQKLALHNSGFRSQDKSELEESIRKIARHIYELATNDETYQNERSEAMRIYSRTHEEVHNNHKSHKSHHHHIHIHDDSPSFIYPFKEIPVPPKQFIEQQRDMKPAKSHEFVIRDDEDDEHVPNTHHQEQRKAPVFHPQYVPNAQAPVPKPQVVDDLIDLEEIPPSPYSQAHTNYDPKPFTFDFQNANGAFLQNAIAAE